MDAEGLGPLLDRCVSRLEGAFRIALPRGRTRGLRCMFHLWEPLRTIYRWEYRVPKFWVWQDVCL